jgi:hypothetical protein
VGVHGRILIGVAAWLLGAGAATGGSLLAVSALGQGIGGISGQQLTVAAVDRALASEADETDGPGAASPSVLSATRPPVARTPRGRASPTVGSPAEGSPPPTPAPPAGPSTQPPDGAALTSQGGSVVASCAAAGAYLMSWSPQQGYEVGGVFRGPAATARVTFNSNANSVTMLVSCSAGVPVATSYVHSSHDE